MDTDHRPLSPHLQIYDLPLTAKTSIAHRITGALLSLGTLVLVYWLVAAAAGPEAYATAQALIGSWLGQILVFLWTFAFFFHFCNGIRHLVWDVGYGFELETAQKAGVAIIVAAAVLTVVVWAVALSV